MFKKLLLATIIVLVGLWGAGYDVRSIKDELQSAAKQSAAATSGRAQSEDSGWGPDA